MCRHVCVTDVAHMEPSTIAESNQKADCSYDVEFFIKRPARVGSSESPRYLTVSHMPDFVGRL